jgi:hypothetical protein
MQLSQRSDYYPVIACSFLSATAIQIFVQVRVELPRTSQPLLALSSPTYDL